MSVDFNALAAWAAVVAALAAVVALWTESRRSRFALGVDLILKLDERFNSEEMRRARRAAAKSLLDKTHTEADEVLDFFEMIGFLARRGALDEKMIWETFFYWIYRYWHCAKEYIERQREGDPTLWANAAHLYKRVVAIEKCERRCSDADMSLKGESSRNFLVEESQLP